MKTRKVKRKLTTKTTPEADPPEPVPEICCECADKEAEELVTGADREVQQVRASEEEKTKELDGRIQELQPRQHSAQLPLHQLQREGAVPRLESTGFAAALCKKHKANPREVGQKHIKELRDLIGFGAKETNASGPRRS